MATNTLYSKEDVKRLLEIKENWVPITESMLQKNTTVWDGTRQAVFKVTGWQTAHPELGKVYILRDLHTGVSTPVKIDEVNANYKKFQLSEEAKRLKEIVRPVQYRVYMVHRGSPYETENPPTTDLDEAVSHANDLHIKSGQVFIVRNLKTGDIVHRADAPIPTVPGEAQKKISSENAISGLRLRKRVKLTEPLMKPGIVVVHSRSDEFFVYDGPNPNDKTRHTFSNLRTGEAAPDVPAIIAMGLYDLVVPYEDDLVNLIPWFPRDVYGMIIQIHGDVYRGVKSPPAEPKGEKTPAPDTGSTVIDVSGTSRRSVGKAAAERGILKPEGGGQFVVQYFQKNWTSPRIFEKGYKSEYQATRRAEKLFGEPGVVWVSVIDTKDNNKRVFVSPPGFNPDDKASELPPGDSFSIRYLDVDGNWVTYEREYKTYTSAVNRARKLVEESKRSIVRAEVAEAKTNRLLHVVNLRGIDLKTFGVIPPEKADEVSVVGEDVVTVADGTLRTTPTPVVKPAPARKPAPAPISSLAPPKTPEESLRDLDKIIALRPQPSREGIREELSLTVSRKLVALACVSAISRYNVSVAEATIICQENGEKLDEIAGALARNEIDLYTAVQKIDHEIVTTYGLVDLRVQTPAPVADAPSGETIDLGPALRAAVRSELAGLTAQRVTMVSRSSGTVSRDELTEAAYEVAFGKRKRSTTKADVVVSFLNMGSATPEQIWDDYEIVVRDDPREGMSAKFYLSITSQGYILRQDEGKTYPARGFLGVVEAMRKKYGADIVVDGDRDRVDFDLLM